jgi:hypothetical protein
VSLLAVIRLSKTETIDFSVSHLPQTVAWNRYRRAKTVMV